jgi:hypothetical protein
MTWEGGLKTDLREAQLYNDALTLILSAHWYVLLALHVAMIRKETKMQARLQRIDTTGFATIRTLRNTISFQ